MAAEVSAQLAIDLETVRKVLTKLKGLRVIQSSRGRYSWGKGLTTHMRAIYRAIKECTHPVGATRRYLCEVLEMRYNKIGPRILKLIDLGYIDYNNAYKDNAHYYKTIK